MRRVGLGESTLKLIKLIKQLLLKNGEIDRIDEAWIMPATGYYLSQDVYRWEGQIKGRLNNRNVILQIASWEKIKDCIYSSLEYSKDGYFFEFYSGP